MAGLEADTSSYNQPLPVGPLEMTKNIAQTRSAVQQNQSNDLSINNQKIELAQKALNALGTAVTSLGPNASKEQYKAVGANVAKAFNLPPEAIQSWNERIDAAKTPQEFYNQAITAIGDHGAAVGYHLGQRTDVDNGQTITPAVTSVKPGFGVKPIAAPIQRQNPVGTESTDNARTLPNGQPNPNYGAKSLIGPQAPAIPQGAVPAGNLPGQYQMPVAPRSGPTGPTVDTTPTVPTTFDNRFAASRPSGVVPTGLPPGTSEAIGAVSKKSGEDYATDLTRAKNFQAELYPAVRVLDILKEEGPQAFGVGTENLNTLKNGLVTWFPNVDPKTIQSVSNFEEAKKQMVALSRSSGNTGTNDQLAAAFEANPNTKMSGATIENVIKSIVSLRKMQHAQTLLFGQQNLPESEYSKWISKNQNTLDPRAFGFDMMNDAARLKLVTNIKKDPKAYQKFETSLQFAHDAGLIEPPARK